MPGPLPKDPQLRQRQNRSSTRAVLTSDAQPRKRAPRLPRGHDWREETRAWWAGVWHSPMAAEYLDSDVHALYRLARLVDEFWLLPTKELAGEIRLEQQAFGLSPLDRRRLEWSIEQAETATTRRQRRRVRQALDGEADPRTLLVPDEETRRPSAIAA